MDELLKLLEGLSSSDGNLRNPCEKLLKIYVFTYIVFIKLIKNGVKFGMFETSAPTVVEAVSCASASNTKTRDHGRGRGQHSLQHRHTASHTATEPDEPVATQSDSSA